MRHIHSTILPVVSIFWLISQTACSGVLNEPDTGAENPDIPEGYPEWAGSMNLGQTVSDVAQSTTIAFNALAFMTGNLCSDTFLPPGKFADFFGYQYLRDNDSTDMGHNTLFAGTVGENILFILTDAQVSLLADMASEQIEDIEAFGYARFTLMDAFRRLMEGDIPDGSDGLSLQAVQSYSAEQLYRLDGEISYERALVFAQIINEMDQDQLAAINDLVGVGANDWPDRSQDTDVQRWRRELPHEEHVALMTYAGQLFSWYAGTVEADVYFCPERHGTYFGSFYMKAIPAMMAQQQGVDFGIDPNLTADYGNNLLATLTQEQEDAIMELVDDQRSILDELVQTRREISHQLRLLWMGTDEEREAVETNVLELSERYGELDGELNHLYAATFAMVFQTLSPQQLETLRMYRESSDYLNLNPDFGDPCSVNPDTNAYLFSSAIDTPQIENTDWMFTQ